jgi:GT2 family glycosyltransferase
VNVRDHQTVNQIEVTWCVVNTAQRERLRECLDALLAERDLCDFATETIVLDNCSLDGSVEMASTHPVVSQVIALKRRQGKAASDTQLIEAANGRFCLLLNEDAILEPSATAKLREALLANPAAAAAGANLLRPGGQSQPCAWRFPSWLTVLAGALLLHNRVTVQSGGASTIEVDWAQSAAMLVSRERALAVGCLDTNYFVYSDETDFCRRLADRGWQTLHVPDAVATHHEGLSTGASVHRRIVEFGRGRDRYLRTHIGKTQALLMRPFIAFPYALRWVAALALPGHEPERYRWHIEAALRPGRGEGMREAAARFNLEIEASS